LLLPSLPRHPIRSRSLRPPARLLRLSSAMFSHGADSAHDAGAVGVSSGGATVPTRFVWPYGGKRVFVSGSFTRLSWVAAAYVSIPHRLSLPALAVCMYFYTRDSSCLLVLADSCSRSFACAQLVSWFIASQSNESGRIYAFLTLYRSIIGLVILRFLTHQLHIYRYVYIPLLCSLVQCICDLMLCMIRKYSLLNQCSFP
jgi:hypothetical protein